MKILLFSQRFWPENFRINLIVKKFIEKNNKNKFLIVTEKPNYPEGNIFENYKKKKINEHFFGCKIFRMFTIPRGNTKFFLLLNYINFIIFGSFFVIISDKIRKFKVDVIIVYGTSPIFQAIPAIVAGKILNVPVILWVQDLWPNVLKDLKIVKNKFLLKFINIFVNLIYTNCNFLYVQSNSYRKFLKKEKKLKQKKIRVLYNPEISYKSEFKETKNKKFTICYAGNLGIAQSNDILIKAAIKFRFNQKLEFKIYGDGSEKNKLVKQIKLNKLKNVKIYKSVRPKKIKSILFSSDALLLILSKGDGLSKTMPAKLQTYLAIGRPILISADGEAFEFVKEHKLGFVSKAEDLNSFIKNINEAKKLSIVERKKIYKRSKSIFNKKFEINKWILNFNNMIKRDTYDFKKK